MKWPTVNEGRREGAGCDGPSSVQLPPRSLRLRLYLYGNHNHVALICVAI